MIKFITDSASDIPPKEEKDLNIDVMPIPITIGDDGYYERKDFTPVEFYNILNKSTKIPVTSHINTLEFLKKYKETYKAGYDEIIHVTISSTGSTMFESAKMARDMFYKEDESLRSKIQIHIIDSKTYSYGYGLAVIEGAKKAQEGRSINEVLSYMEDYFNKVEVYFSVYSLNYAKKSGRISVAATFVGEMLGLRPIISIIDGKMKIIDKVRGDKNIPDKLAEIMLKNINKQDPKYGIIVGSLDHVGETLKSICSKHKDKKFVDKVKAGASITINSGPEVLGITFLGKNRQ